MVACSCNQLKLRDPSPVAGVFVLRATARIPSRSPRPSIFSSPPRQRNRFRTAIVHSGVRLSVFAGSYRRRFGRHQAPEAHLVMKGPAGVRKPITVVIRDVLAASARDVGEAVEAAASAFAVDTGGFSQMEIVLCGWNEDIESVLNIENYSWVLMTDPWERLQANSFSLLSRWDAKAGQRPAGHEWAGTLNGHEEPVLALIEASLGARFKPGRQYRRSFIRRPDLAL